MSGAKIFSKILKNLNFWVTDNRIIRSQKYWH